MRPALGTDRNSRGTVVWKWMGRKRRPERDEVRWDGAPTDHGWNHSRLWEVYPWLQILRKMGCPISTTREWQVHRERLAWGHSVAPTTKPSSHTMAPSPATPSGTLPSPKPRDAAEEFTPSLTHTFVYVRTYVARSPPVAISQHPCN